MGLNGSPLTDWGVNVSVNDAQSLSRSLELIRTDFSCWVNAAALEKTLHVLYFLSLQDDDAVEFNSSSNVRWIDRWTNYRLTACLWISLCHPGGNTAQRSDYTGRVSTCSSPLSPAEGDRTTMDWGVRTSNWPDEKVKGLNIWMYSTSWTIRKTKSSDTVPVTLYQRHICILIQSSHFAH